MARALNLNQVPALAASLTVGRCVMCGESILSYQRRTALAGRPCHLDCPSAPHVPSPRRAQELNAAMAAERRLRAA